MTALSKLNDYPQDFQLKIIALLLADKKFLINVAEGVKVNYFENESHQWLVKTILDYYQKYHTVPTKDVVETAYKKLSDGVIVEQIRLTVIKCYRIANEAMSDREWIESEFKQFCLNQSMKNAILDAVGLLEVGDFPAIFAKIANVNRLTTDRHIGTDAAKDVETVLRDEDRKVVAFKSQALNDITKGGYGSGDLVLYVGSPGGGKTTMIISDGADALKAGKNILHYSLELTEAYTMQKYYSCLVNVEVKDLKVHREEIDEFMAEMPGRLIVKAYPPKKATFQTIENHMQNLRMHEDFIPDIVIIDYLDYVRSYTPRLEKKEELDDVYIQAKSFAAEHGVPVLSPTQANRSASKLTIIEGDTLAGSYDKLMIADIVFSLARTTKDKNAGIGRLHLIKNRHGPDGMTFLCEIDIARNYIRISDEPMTEEELDNADRIPKKSMNEIVDKVNKLFDN